LIVVLLGGFAPYRIAGPHAAASHSVAASDLRTGNCFNMTSGSSAVTSVQVQEISCDQPHNFQVYAEPAITDSSFSGAAIAHSDADETCNDFDSISAVSDIVPVGYTIIDFYPGSASAFASQKDFICVLQVPNQTDESWLTSDNTN
jgi:hypothetical protein